MSRQVQLEAVVGRQRRRQPALRPVARGLGQRRGGHEHDAGSLPRGAQRRVQAGRARADDGHLGLSELAADRASAEPYRRSQPAGARLPSAAPCPRRPEVRSRRCRWRPLPAACAGAGCPSVAVGRRAGLVARGWSRRGRRRRRSRARRCRPRRGCAGGGHVGGRRRGTGAAGELHQRGREDPERQRGDHRDAPAGPFQFGVAARRVRAAAPQCRHHPGRAAAARRTAGMPPRAPRRRAAGLAGETDGRPRGRGGGRGRLSRRLTAGCGRAHDRRGFVVVRPPRLAGVGVAASPGRRRLGGRAWRRAGAGRRPAGGRRGAAGGRGCGGGAGAGGGRRRGGAGRRRRAGGTALGGARRRGAGPGAGRRARAWRPRGGPPAGRRGGRSGRPQLGQKRSSLLWIAAQRGAGGDARPRAAPSAAALARASPSSARSSASMWPSVVSFASTSASLRWPKRCRLKTRPPRSR